MAYPSFDELTAFTPNQQRQLQQFAAYLVEGFLQREHAEDGTHAAVTADSVSTPALAADAVAIEDTLSVGGASTLDGPVTIAPTTTDTPLDVIPASGATVVAKVGGEATAVEFHNLQTVLGKSVRSRLLTLAWTASGSGATATWTFDLPSGASLESGAVTWNSSAGNEMATISKTGVASPAFQTTTALVATGGGSGTPALVASSTGGTDQPTTANQHGWLKALDDGGNTIWIPVWT